eukprot:IDg10559t1
MQYCAVICLQVCTPPRAALSDSAQAAVPLPTSSPPPLSILRESEARERSVPAALPAAAARMKALRPLLARVRARCAPLPVQRNAPYLYISAFNYCAYISIFLSISLYPTAPSSFARHSTFNASKAPPAPPMHAAVADSAAGTTGANYPPPSRPAFVRVSQPSQMKSVRASCFNSAKSCPLSPPPQNMIRSRAKKRFCLLLAFCVHTATRLASMLLISHMRQQQVPQFPVEADAPMTMLMIIIPFARKRHLRVSQHDAVHSELSYRSNIQKQIQRGPPNNGRSFDRLLL